jgi:hypothetical protein
MWCAPTAVSIYAVHQISRGWEVITPMDEQGLPSYWRSEVVDTNGQRSKGLCCYYGLTIANPAECDI